MKKKVLPSSDYLQSVFDCRDGELYWRKNGKRAGFLAKAGQGRSYWVVGLDRKRYLAHRIIWAWHGRDLNPEHVIDHINEDSLDNRIENLQQIEQAQNISKARKRSLPAGVRQFGEKFQASGGYPKKEYLGTFVTADEAHQAYLDHLSKQALQYRGNQRRDP